MKVLLDECVDQRLAADIRGHEVKTAPEMGWANLKNGQLLTLAQAEFDVFVTLTATFPISKTFSNTTLRLLCCEPGATV